MPVYHYNELVYIDIRTKLAVIFTLSTPLFTYPFTSRRPRIFGLDGLGREFCVVNG